ncbi:hypothetical protein ACHAP9_008040 [Verticillium nonalfalfae]
MSHKPKDPLDQLQYMLNDVIIQIGKALKASTKQPNRQNVSQIHASLQTRMPETIENFHWALNDLESEVPEEAIKASPAPMIASPASVTLVVASPELAQKPPPSPPLKEEPTRSAPFSAAQESPAPPPMAPMAPIPDMGGNDSMPTPVQPKADIKREPTPSVPQAMMAPMDSIPVKSEETPAMSSVAPDPSMSTAPEAPMDDLFDLSGGENEGGRGNGSEFDFTDITFGLDPSVDSQSQPTADVAPQPDMGTTSGLPATAEMSTLDGLLPVAAPVQSAATTASTAVTTTEPPKIEGDRKAGDPQSTAAVDNDIFDLDGIGGNMDLDMNLGNNGDGSSFDDMFYGGDNNMDDVQFDDAFFGLSN